ncbi:LuxR C-terminal-related transcriptional regulator [Curtobacterium flaccumfaciens]|uniref:LuxR C-terminal-related transcriptional regulator n=1 Tax=Curtobacterium flaccumfaciens TaxID=2035 RepID=UPI001FEA5FCA|nr:LuxR C-terminal-related transcriptional regulator [Curtobacterium flaccumfaciens]
MQPVDGTPEPDSPPPPKLAERVTAVGHRDGWQQATALIGTQWDEYATTAPEQLLDAIGALPGKVLLENSGLVVAANYLRQVAGNTEPHRFDRDGRLPAFPVPESGRIAEQLILLTGTVANARTRGDVTSARDAAREARRRLAAAANNPARSNDLEDAKGNLPHLFVQWGRALEASDTDGASFEYEEAHHAAIVTNQPQIARRAAGSLAWFHAERGRPNLAAEWLTRAWASGQPNPRYEAVNHLAAALVALEHDDRRAAGVELARLRAYPIGEYWAAALWLRAFHASGPAESTLVENELAGEVDRHQTENLSPVDARYLRAAKLTLGIGDASLTPTKPTPYDRLLDAVEAYTRGAFEEVLNFAHDPAELAATPRVRSNALLVSSVAALALEDHSLAREHFERAAAILQAEGMTTPYRLLPPDVLTYFTESTGVLVPAALQNEAAATPMALGSLTKRERQILELLTTRAPFPEIATQLFISPNTVKTAAQRLYRKLNVNSRQEAAELARRAGIRPTGS